MTIKTKLHEQKRDMSLRVELGLKRAKALGQYITGQRPGPDTEAYFPVVRGELGHVREKLTQSVRQIVHAAARKVSERPKLKLPLPPKSKARPQAKKPAPSTKPSTKAKALSKKAQAKKA